MEEKISNINSAGKRDCLLPSIRIKITSHNVDDQDYIP